MNKQRKTKISKSVIIIVLIVGVLGFPASAATPTLLECDINTDKIITSLDLIDIANQMHETGVPGWIKADVDKNGIIQVLDLMFVASHYGESLTTTTETAGPTKSWGLQWQTDVPYLPASGTMVDRTLINPVLYDITGDGVQDIFVEKGYSGNGPGAVYAFNGATGALMWRYGPVNNLGHHAAISIHNLDGGSDMELLVCGFYVTTAVHAESGQVLWSYRAGIEPGTIVSRREKAPVVLEENGIVYAYTYIGGNAENGGSIYPRIVKRLGSTGEIVASTSAHLEYTCFGGLTAADINDDGVIEIVIGNRVGEYSGLACFRASDLVALWDTGISCSSQSPVIVDDLNGNGGMDVIVNNQRTGKVAAVDGKRGTILWQRGSIGRTGDIWMNAIYDIDGDGNLEAMTAGGGSGSTAMTIIDLETGATEASLGSFSGPPIIANVDSDAAMEIIQINQDTSYKIYNYDNGRYTLTVQSTPNRVKTYTYAMTILDMDNDGYNEIVQLCQDTALGWLTFDTVQVVQTPGLASTPKATCQDYAYTYLRNYISQYTEYDNPE